MPNWHTPILPLCQAARLPDCQTAGLPHCHIAILLFTKKERDSACPAWLVLGRTLNCRGRVSRGACIGLLGIDTFSLFLVPCTGGQCVSRSIGPRQDVKLPRSCLPRFLYRARVIGPRSAKLKWPAPQITLVLPTKSGRLVN